MSSIRGVETVSGGRQLLLFTLLLVKTNISKHEQLDCRISSMPGLILNLGVRTPGSVDRIDVAVDLKGR